jgi:NAD(P)-dependent dehydrogenase (short-subunit alcohol dehydrogenase family)
MLIIGQHAARGAVTQSLTLTTGQSYLRPMKGWAAQIGVAGAIPATARGLAVDLAPLRVNCVSPGLVATEMQNVHYQGSFRGVMN